MGFLGRMGIPISVLRSRPESISRIIGLYSTDSEDVSEAMRTLDNAYCLGQLVCFELYLVFVRNLTAVIGALGLMAEYRAVQDKGRQLIEGITDWERAFWVDLFEKGVNII